MESTVPEVMARNDATLAAYEALDPILRAMGDIEYQPKKSSVHVAAGKAAFLGIHPRKAGLRLNIVLDHPLEGPRIVKSEQVSKSRYHNEVDVALPSDFDDDLCRWIGEAYTLQTRA